MSPLAIRPYKTMPAVGSFSDRKYASYRIATQAYYNRSSKRNGIRSQVKLNGEKKFDYASNSRV